MPGSLPMYKPHVKPAQTRNVKGTVHFLGGAFAGASPQLTYPLLLDALTAAGYTVITTPFPITFQHLDCANEVRKSFQDTLAKLREGGKGYMVPDDRPVHGVGHSMGALLHTLIGSTERQPVASNVLLSFNNLQVAEAIPIPGLLDGLGPGVRSSAELQQALGMTPPSPVQLLQASMQLLPQPLQRPELIPQLVPLLDQVGSVLGEVGGGTVDFQPTPDEARDLISKNYSVPNTLMVRFSDDSIDETPELATLLQVRFPSVPQESHGPGPKLLQLPGSHVTPCGADLMWSPEGVFTPGDAVLAATKAALQLDVRRLETHMVEWLDAF